MKKKNYARVCRIASRMCVIDNKIALAEYFYSQYKIYANSCHVTRHTARELIKNHKRFKMRTFSAKIKNQVVEVEALTEEDAWWMLVDIAGGSGFEYLVKSFAEGESLWN